MDKVELGDEVVDRITNFQGTATGVARYLTGCVRFLVEREGDTHGSPPQELWIDEIRLRIIKRETFTIPEVETEQEPAGPQSIPTRQDPR